MQAIHTYLATVAKLAAGSQATEHSYRPALEAMLKAVIGIGYEVTNEPKRRDCGAPDFIIEKDKIPVGFVEAKAIGRLNNLTALEKNQMVRYTSSLDNLIYTDCLEFRLYRQGELKLTCIVAQQVGNKIEPIPAAVDQLVNMLREFASYRTQTIKSAEQLAKMMAAKALLVRDVFTNILKAEVGAEGRSSLHDQYDAFKQVLLHTVTHEEFADIYAETLAYGLFTARLHDTTLDSFSRGEAYGLIPRSNPFLRELFTYVGTKLDERAEWIVDALCDIFRATDVHKLVHDFYRGKARKDPFLHFYETFLGEYNPAKRKARGVWYTPEPVVSFIVRAVDDVLKTHFNLPMGLADTSQTTIKVPEQTADKRHKGGLVEVERTVHRVQVLDVATGTGTFLAEVIAQIHAKYAAQQGMWSSYVEQHLIPRLHGFELLMASYAMCHMKLELLLQETGYKPKATPPRLSVYLTNSLQKPHAEVDQLPLIEWFSRESNEASRIKRQSPIMVAIGNPPYSGVSSNMGDDLIVDIEDYKYVDGVHFGERKHWLHDDYVKFIRLGEHFIAKNGEGVLGYITNHSWLDNPTFRGMRWHLLNTFDEIYILDLHGNSKKKEICPDGSADKNVFDIQQGVAIIVGVKRKSAAKTKPLATVHHAELWGSREVKNAALDAATLANTPWQTLAPVAPFYFFVPKDMTGDAEYQQGFGLKDLFLKANLGLMTARDDLFIDTNSEILSERIQTAINGNGDNAFKQKYDIKNTKSYPLSSLLTKVTFDNKNISNICYRPLDFRSCYYDPKLLSRSLYDVQQHMLNPNVSLIVGRQGQVVGNMQWNLCLVANALSDLNLFYRGGGYTFPLYLYQAMGSEVTKTPNLAPDLWKKLIKAAGKAAEDPQTVFDYIYAVLHAPTYRSTYAAFLKSDFPRIPYPTSPAQFSALAALGAELRQLHLLEHPSCTPTAGMATYPTDGSHVVEAVKYAEGKVYINATQHFADVPQVAWEFYIGGYQPAQKWLKDRKGRALSFEDIQHYQRIIATLTHTHALMPQVDGVYTQSV